MTRRPFFTVTTARDGIGYSYKIEISGLTVAQGWSAGTRDDAIEEAERALIRLNAEDYTRTRG